MDTRLPFMNATLPFSGAALYGALALTCVAGLCARMPCVGADFGSYLEAQARLDRSFRDEEDWTRMAMLNCA
eukprot:943354-Rhodomonas_salina.1